MVEYCLRRQTHQIDGNEVIVTKVIPKFDEEDQVNIGDQDGEDQVEIGDDAEKVDGVDQDNGASDKVDGGSENLIGNEVDNSGEGVKKDVSEEAENATSQEVEREVSTEEIGNALV